MGRTLPEPTGFFKGGAVEIFQERFLAIPEKCDIQNKCSK
jgi:hypothetical protein